MCTWLTRVVWLHCLEEWLTLVCCAFVACLPNSVCHILRAGSRLENMDITQIMNRARAVLAEENVGAGSTTSHADSIHYQHKAAAASSTTVSGDSMGTDEVRIRLLLGGVCNCECSASII